jgi:hypothetical protein
VALSVPHVINCFTAAGPSSAAVGEGRSGTREKPIGDLGRSRVEEGYRKIEPRQVGHLQGVPVIAASIRLLDGLGGDEGLCEVAEEENSE